MKKHIFLILLWVLAFSEKIFKEEVRLTRAAIHQKFKEWKSQNKRKYQGKQNGFRQAVFQRNAAKLRTKQNNKKNFTEGVNKFADWTAEEFSEILLKSKGVIINQNEDQIIVNPSQQLLVIAPSATIATTTRFSPNKPLPKPLSLNRTKIAPSNPIIDWQAAGKLGPIKNQGACGSCWAFSAVGMVESMNIIKYGKNVSLSVQQLVNCEKNSFGCSGGYSLQAQQYMVKYGINYEKTYPYVSAESGATGVCNITRGGPYKVKAMHYVNGCKQIHKALQFNPLVITVNAATWQFYTGGVLDNDCGSGDKGTHSSHDVVLVGRNPGKWLKIMNSWGTTWGEKGYIRMADRLNMCNYCVYTSTFSQL